MAFRLEGGNVFFFILRQDTGDDLRNVETLANGFSRALVVPGQHDDVDAHFGKVGNGFGTRFFFDVGDGDDADNFFFIGKEERRLAVVGQGVEGCRNGCRIDVDFIHEADVAGVIGFSVDDGLDTAAEESLKITGGFPCEAVIGSIGIDSFGQGVFTAFFEGGSEAD